jgi:hypothetical protein
VNQGKKVNCVLCDYQEEIREPGLYLIECKKCGTFNLLTRSPTKTIRDIAQDHLLSGFTREKWEFDGICVCLDDNNNIESIRAKCPQKVKEKADKFLIALQRQTKHFGQQVPVKYERDYPLAYAQNQIELVALIDYLIESKLIERFSPHGPPGEYDFQFKVTAKGIDAIETRLLSPPLTVFISSTCYDLLDLRTELVDFLEPKGFIVKVSDDPYHIDVEPTENSIETCLRNVDSSDVIICIVDGRYGPLLPPDKQISATHAEIRHARELKRPVYIFGRDKALSDYDQLRKNPDASALWVEKHELEQRKKWVAFVRELQDLYLAQEQGHSNWIDQFTTSVQLKKLVLKRLSEI